MRLPAWSLVPSEQVYRVLLLTLSGGLTPVPGAQGLREASSAHVPGRVVHGSFLWVFAGALGGI